MDEDVLKVAAWLALAGSGLFAETVLIFLLLINN